MVQCKFDLAWRGQCKAAPKAAPAKAADSVLEDAARWTTEQEHAIRQGNEIEASDGYFEARPWVEDNSARRKVFQAGFERGWDAARKQAAPKTAPVAQTAPAPGERCQHCIDRHDGIYGSWAAPCPYHDDDGKPRPTANAAPQQEAQEPVAYVHVPHFTVEGKVRPVVSFEKYQQDYADGIYSTRIPLYAAPQPAPDCHHRPPCNECAAIAAQGGKV